MKNELKQIFDAKQIHAAIALAGLNDTKLAAELGMQKSHLSQILSGKMQPQEETQRKIMRKLEDKGIEFMPQSGVRLLSDIVQVFEGHAGQRKFNEDRYHVATNSSQDFLYCGSNTQADVEQSLSKELSAEYSALMQTVKHFKMRGLRPMRDAQMPFASHIEYRALPEEDFPPMKFYIYGGKVAILRWLPEFRAIVINDREMNSDYRAYFERLWKVARPYSGEGEK